MRGRQQDAVARPQLCALAEVAAEEPVGATLCSCRSIAAIYTIPTLHNPFGYVISRTPRDRLVEIARRYDCAIIEDGTYAFLEPSGAPTIYELAPERTVHVASLSKNLAPGLRIGFIVTPDHHIALAKEAVRTSTWGTASLVSALATGWLTDGTVTRLEKDRRTDARRRQEIARDVLQGCDTRPTPRPTTDGSACPRAFAATTSHTNWRTKASSFPLPKPSA